ncbi:YheC/YheD family protein [Mesobacillus harenae]|uniref:YheC/YheD family endospore coat-associated protein n=1 Tax=Mesobacillus harenae TaxID=2213203 RepID=UPI0015800B6C|nr:YheC/YheD family protein [Mesobacillus harenae]
MRKRYPIKISDMMNNVDLYYPADLEINQPIEKIAFGGKTADVTCKPHPGGKNIVIMRPELQSALHFPDLNINLHLIIDNATLYIGPLIGIFTSGFTTFPSRPIGARSLFFAKLLSVNKMVGALPYVFGEEHIDWENGLIQAYVHLHTGWQQIPLPFPNVIYDRLPNRRSERKTELSKIKTRLQEDYLIPWYNPGFFSKLDVFERLEQDPMVSSLLPETHLFSSFTEIERMLADYGHVFIKPNHGSLGIGVHQILYNKHDESYYCRFKGEDDLNKLTRFKSLEGLMKYVFKKRKLSNMLVQQGIHLIRINKSSVDFRVHTNRDENGNWKVTAIAAKVAGPGSVTTHINSGGVIKTINELFESESDQKYYEAELTYAALNLSKSLEATTQGIIGEIGFDLGIDKDGKVWLFEANSKPGRSIFTHPQLRDFDLLTRKLPIAFGIYLSEQAIKKPADLFR